MKILFHAIVDLSSIHLAVIAAENSLECKLKLKIFNPRVIRTMSIDEENILNDIFLTTLISLSLQSIYNS